MNRAGLLLLLVGCHSEPKRLSETGLYEELGVVSPDAIGYTPRFALWSDGADKARWIQLPEGESIDTSDPDAWVFPEDTRVWKEFAFDGGPVETRMLHKVNGGWTTTVYQWLEDGSDAVKVRNGVKNARGSYDIPSEKDCSSCHEHAPDGPLGLSAVQLAEGEDRLVALLDTPLDPVQMPGDALDAEVLGLLDANCGTCHDAEHGMDHPLDLSLSVYDLAAVAGTPAFQTAVDAPATGDPIPGMDASLLIDPGKPAQSLLWLRLSARGDGQMPPLATEEVDVDLVDRVEEWIARLGVSP